MRPSRAGGSVEGKQALGSNGTPFLYEGDGGTLYWVYYPPPTPAQWLVYTSSSPSGPFTVNDTFNGAFRDSEDTTYPNQFVYIQGDDGSGSGPVGNRSNVIHTTP